MDSISFMQFTTPVLAPTTLDAPSGSNLDPFPSNNRALPLFIKIRQSFILMQNSYKRDWIGRGEIFVSRFLQKNAHFDQY